MTDAPERIWGDYERRIRADTYVKCNHCYDGGNPQQPSRPLKSPRHLLIQAEGDTNGV